MSTTTDRDGNFELLLDPGHYRFDYDPPPNAPIPRKTEPDVLVDGFITFEVRLDPAAYVAGVVYGPGDKPLPMATIRLYDVRCTGNHDDCFGPNRTPPCSAPRPSRTPSETSLRSFHDRNRATLLTPGALTRRFRSFVLPNALLEFVAPALRGRFGQRRSAPPCHGCRTLRFPR